jgi:hypothetical protein
MLADAVMSGEYKTVANAAAWSMYAQLFMLLQRG